MSSARILIVLLFCLSLQAAVISGSIKDSSGAPAAHVRVEISGGALIAPLTLDTDIQGHFATQDLKPGTYVVRVTATGFKPISQTVDLADKARDLSIDLQVAALRQEVTVERKISSQANSNLEYRALREATLGATYQAKAASVFSQWKEDVRTRHIEERSFTDSLFRGDDIENADAE